ncbi:MAG: VPLPA-CTERM sorting domain-containing protein [Bdellovibrionales bacterium]
MRTLFTFLAAAILSLYSIPAGAVALTFDDIAVDSTGLGVVGDHYQNAELTWSNFYVMNRNLNPVVSGFSIGVMSPNQLAFNGALGDTGIAMPASLSSSKLFTFNGGSFIAGWNDGLTLLITGLKAGAEVYTREITLSASSIFSLADLNWLVDEVTFFSYGGEAHGYTGGHGTAFGVDNLRFGGLPDGDTIDNVPGRIPDVPLPAALPLFLCGMAGLGIVARRRKV